MSSSNHERDPMIQPLRMRVQVGDNKSRYCDLNGGAAEQLRWLMQAQPFFNDASNALDEALAGVDDASNRLVRALAYPEVRARTLDSQLLICDIWRADGGLGPYPLLEVLAELQVQHAFYPAYRDHLMHQVRVWVLGLYLMHRMPRLFEALVAEVRTEPDWNERKDDEVKFEALRRWKVASLWHDIGYVFEVQSSAEPFELIQKSFDSLNQTYATPLARLLGEHIVSPAAEHVWSGDFERPLPSWPNPVCFDTLMARNQKLWGNLAPAGWASRLAHKNEPTGGFEPYLELCRKGELEVGCGRDHFIDHGISGALLLLALHEFQKAYFTQLDALLEDEPTLASREQRMAVRRVRDRTLDSATTVIAASQAIALHNIAPGIVRSGSAAAHSLTPKRFRIGPTPGDGLVLAFLLSLADGLQGWDRPRFDAPRSPEDIGLIDQDVVLSADQHRVYLDFEMAEAEAVPLFNSWREDLEQRMEGIGALLHRGVAPNLAPRTDLERGATPTVSPSEFDLGPYLRAVLRECGTIQLRGFLRSGRIREATSIPIEEIYAPMQVERGEESLWRLLAGTGTRGNEALLLLGDPGSGKSTFLRMTASVLAHAQLGQEWAIEHPAATAFTSPSRNKGKDEPKDDRVYAPVEESDNVENNNGSEDNGPPVPLLIRLPELSSFISSEDLRKQRSVMDPGLLKRFVGHWAEANRVEIPLNTLESWMRDGKAILLLDGLDEIPSRKLREQITGIIARAASKGVYGACRICLTSRPIRDEEIHPVLRPQMLAGLSDESIESFLERWARFVVEGEGKHGGEAAEYVADLLSQAHNASPAIKRMLRNPLMLTSLAVIHWNEGRLPEQRSELLDAIITWLLRAREIHRESFASLGEHQRRRVFQSLALDMHVHRGGRIRDITFEEAAGVIEEFFPGTTRRQRKLQAERFMETETVLSGIITPRGQNHLQFWHLSFQELLVAELIAGKTESKWSEILTAKRLKNPEWREVVLLLAGRLGGAERTQALLRMIVEPALQSSLVEKAHAYSLAMAAVQDLKQYQFIPDPSIGFAELSRDVMHVFGPGSTKVPLALRVETAEALGQAGDPRLQEEIWVEVEPDLYFSKFPVTVQEFRLFVDDGGYEHCHFGSGLERRWLGHEARQQPELWEEQLTTPNRPVVNVSWIEAEAYCRWLTRRRRDGHRYRLPSASEWEHAALGANGKGPFPWGAAKPRKGNTARANYSMAELDKPSPVGLFPAGATDWGDAGTLLDMAGNVWEWCAEDSCNCRQHPESDVGRPLKGGAYWSLAPDLKVSNRLFYITPDRGDGVGFRVVRCPTEAA